MSVGGSLSVSSGSYLHCPLCLDEFSATNPKLQPRLLPSCAHSLCTRCLHQQWAIQAAEMAHPTFLCPIDAHPVRVTQVEDIPINKILIGLLNMMGASLDSERDFRIGEFGRNRCVEENCENEAVWHCFSDDADLCESHKQATHDGLKSNITKNHRLCRMEEKESKKGPNMCAAHQSALLLWCTECRVHACHACASLAPHNAHPDALKLLGNHGALNGTGILGANDGGAYFSDQQQHMCLNIMEEEKKMKISMEKESKELVQTLQVIDSNELHTQQAIDTEFDNLLASLEQRRFELQAELKRQSASARLACDARMLQLSLNHTLTNTVLEESHRVLRMNPYSQIGYMDNVLVRHEKALEKYYEYAYESSLVSWFPLRLAKDFIVKEIAHLGSIGIPPPPTFKLEECKSDMNALEIVWELTLNGSTGKPGEINNARVGQGAKGSLLSPTNGNNTLNTTLSQSTSSATAAGVSASASPATSISFYILHMSPLDPFDLSQDHVSFSEIYRGPHTSFVVTGLQANSSYLFRVQGVSLMGEGVWSQKICLSTTSKPSLVDHAHGIPQVRAVTEEQQQQSLSQHPNQQQQQQLQQQQAIHVNHSAAASRGPASGYQTPSQFGQAHGMNGSVAPRAQQTPFHIHVDQAAHGAGTPSHQQQHVPRLAGPQRSFPPSVSHSVAHSVVPSRRPSFSGASNGYASFGASASAAGPQPSLALRTSHPQAHAPSLRTSSEELWKLSVILREKDVPVLMRFFLPLAPTSFQLLYRGTRDGMSAASFHLHADQMGPTLTIVRVKKDNRDYVFGGFAAESWTNGNLHASSTQPPVSGSIIPGTKGGFWVSSSQTQAWTFSLINAYKRNMRFRLSKNGEAFALFHADNQGAYFGSGADLVLGESFDSTSASAAASAGPSALNHFGVDQYEFDTEADAKSGLPPFKFPQGHSTFSSTMLAGGENFVCKEVECYAVNF